MTATTRKAPEPRSRSGRKSRWAQVFEEARQDPNVWRMVNWPLTIETATQMASDIRNAHKRTKRPTGIEEGEKFEAAWDKVDGEYHVFVKYVGAA